MVPIFFPLLSGLTARTFVNLVDAQLLSLRQWFGGPIISSGKSPLRKTGPPAIVMQTLSALGAGGGTRTPTTFVTGT